MKKWRYTLAARIVAGVLFMILAMGTLMGAGACVALYQYNAFNDGGEELFAEAADYLMSREINLVENALMWSDDTVTAMPTPTPVRTSEAVLSEVTPEPTDEREPMFTTSPIVESDQQTEQTPEDGEIWPELALPDALRPNRTNFRFAVCSQAGEQLLTNGDPTGSMAYRERTLTIYDAGPVQYVAETYATWGEAVEAEARLHRENWYGSTTVEETKGTWALNGSYRPREERIVRIRCGVDASLPVLDRYSVGLPLVNTLIVCRNWAIPLTALCLVLTIALFIFLLVSAGHRFGTSEVACNWFDRVPLELVLLGMAAVVGFGGVALTSRTLTVFGLFLPLLLALGLLLSMTFAVRCKTKTLVKGTLFYWVWYILKSLPLIWKAVVFWGGVCLVELILGLSMGSFDVWILDKLLLGAALMAYCIGLKKLQAGAERLAAGDMTPVDERHLTPEQRKHARSLNSIGRGMDAAVARQMKSERMKTELITNVSHDLKTPLTSLISYVDLLKKEGLTSERAPEYLDVLDRQSQRLKKLTEDLVEASKASTGNIRAEMEDTDVNMLLSQAAGEYAERLNAANLVPVTTLDPAEPHIEADGRLLWRVFDNLLGNITKYALPGTRVYLTTETKENEVRIAFRNVSREPLNISAEELMERFVRGDASRNTEGSGLGLSIAKSLTELNRGTLDLTVDGDLFKAVLIFKRNE